MLKPLSFFRSPFLSPGVSDFSLSSSACLATACLEGAGPLASLAACDSSTLLCASFRSGIHVLQLRHREELELEKVAVF